MHVDNQSRQLVEDLLAGFIAAAELHAGAGFRPAVVIHVKLDVGRHHPATQEIACGVFRDRPLREVAPVEADEKAVEVPDRRYADGFHRARHCAKERQAGQPLVEGPRRLRGNAHGGLRDHGKEATRSFTPLRLQQVHRLVGKAVGHPQERAIAPFGGFQEITLPAGEGRVPEPLRDLLEHPVHSDLHQSRIVQRMMVGIERSARPQGGVRRAAHVEPGEFLQGAVRADDGVLSLLHEDSAGDGSEEGMTPVLGDIETQLEIKRTVGENYGIALFGDLLVQAGLEGNGGRVRMLRLVGFHGALDGVDPVGKTHPFPVHARSAAVILDHLFAQGLHDRGIVPLWGNGVKRKQAGAEARRSLALHRIGDC